MTEELKELLLGKDDKISQKQQDQMVFYENCEIQERLGFC